MQVPTHTPQFTVSSPSVHGGSHACFGVIGVTVRQAAGALWLAATAAYWASLIAAADAAAQAPAFAPALFTAGGVCFGAMAVATVVAMSLRAARAKGRRPVTV